MAASTNVNGFAERILNNLNKVAQMVNDEAIPIMKNDIQRAFENVIDQFYMEYSPTTYESTGDGMFDLITFGEDENGPYVYIDPEKMNYDTTREHAIGDESGFKQYLYDITFRQGYHGGADKIDPDKVEKYGVHPRPGVPHYRTGAYFMKWDGPAYKAPGDDTPLKKLQDKAEDLKSTKFKKLAQDLFSKYAHHLRDI